MSDEQRWGALLRLVARAQRGDDGAKTKVAELRVSLPVRLRGGGSALRRTRAEWRCGVSPVLARWR